MERETLARWDAERVFARSLERTSDGPPWTLYEGPAPASGMPGAHHLAARVFKDLFPRYKTMRGYHVRRRAGWDCHGLPVEVAVESKLGLSGPADVEAYGIAAFNARCREFADRHVDAFAALTRRMGYWTDLTDAYRTMDPDYIESVWWALKTVYDQGLLVRDVRASPYCPRCGTPLSGHELGQPGVWHEVSGPSATARFRVTGGPDGSSRHLAGAWLLAWTDSPWTLLGTVAVAVHPDASYVIARKTGSPKPGGDRVVVAERLYARVLGEGWHVLDTVPGKALAGTVSTGPFGVTSGSGFEAGVSGGVTSGTGSGDTFGAVSDAGSGVASGASQTCPVVTGTFVTTGTAGTGLVPLAPAFGARHLATGRAHGLPVVNPVRPDGRFADDVPLAGGRYFSDASGPVIEDLSERGLLFASRPHVREAPHCWRCGTALLEYAQPAWRIRTGAVAGLLRAENERTGARPDDYGQSLRETGDWTLSRTRYWGTPLPLWECSAGHVTCVGSLAELSALAGRDLAGLDPHRPGIDAVTFGCPACGQAASRVPEVTDAWFDAGCMPFAQWGAPLHGHASFGDAYPAQLACETAGQTRGWFHSLMTVGTLVFGRSAYENALCVGPVLDSDGRPASSRLGNVTEPLGLLNDHGADAVRWFFAASGSPRGPWRLGPQTRSALDEITRTVLLPWWEAVSFLAERAGPADWDPTAAPGAVTGEAPGAGDAPPLDRWLLTRAGACARHVTDALDAFDPATAARRLAALIDDIASVYLPRTRDRFTPSAGTSFPSAEDPANSDTPGEPRKTKEPGKPEGSGGSNSPGGADGTLDGDSASAFATLHAVLITLTQLMAPLTPFLADHLWRTLRPGQGSVHLSTWPYP